MNNRAIQVVSAKWPAPSRVQALTTLRTGGVSKGGFSALNLAAHVGDAAPIVARNRVNLVNTLGLPSEPRWLRQVHGCQVVDAYETSGMPSADGAFTTKPGVVVTVMTADCIPLFLTNAAGAFVAILHIGWRGLHAGLIEAALPRLPASPQHIMAWTGPGIGRHVYRVGSDVYDALVANFSEHVSAFTLWRDGWLADLPLMIEQRLNKRGVLQVFHSGCCTFSRPNEFFSYRRDGQCGRMASLAWLE